ncbi:MAG TPA: hypothetical protein VHC67_03960 [Gaiellaceae bacterium]|nr:hypothetical protein [Gaiellaceae bacterium]
MLPQSTIRVLARCNGYDVLAADEVVGSVATPVFSGTNLLPDYLLVRVPENGLRAVPPEAVVGADSAQQRVFLSIGPEELVALPERR